ncbi:MAG: hypothetical protein ACFFEE_02155 [Candidatus Thorarchaeota archaeon]
MAFTTMTVTVLSCFVSLIIAIVAGHYYVRNLDPGFLESLFVLVIVVPVISVILSIPLYNLVTLSDWPNIVYVLPPQFAIWIAGVLGGFLGFKSGLIRNQGEASCFYCLVSFASLLVALSLVVVLFL